MRQSLRYLDVAHISLLFLAFQGCLSGDLSSSKSPASVSQVTLSKAGTLTLSGYDLDRVTNVSLKVENREIPLVVQDQDSTRLEVGAGQSITLIPQKVYDLLIVSASAADVIPIRVEGLAASGGLASPSSPGERGPVGPQGERGPVGPQGEPGPIGILGQGASIVVKDGSRTAAYFLTAVNAFASYDGPSQDAMLMLPTNAIIQVSLATGQIIKQVSAVYYELSGCAGKAYLNNRLSAPFPVKGRVIRTDDNRYFEITGHVSSATSLSYRGYFTQGYMGACQNEATTLGNANSGVRPATLQEVAPPASLESLAPLKLQLE